jgi:hypothetical protein
MIIRLSEMENADVWAGFLNHRNASYQLGLEMFIETLNSTIGHEYDTELLN